MHAGAQDIASGRELAVLRGHQDPVWCAAFTPDGKFVITGSHDGTIRVWDMGTVTQVRVIQRGKPVRKLALTPDGAKIVVGGAPTVILDFESAKELRALRSHALSATALAITPDGRHVITGSIRNAIRIWDIESGVEIAKYENVEGVVESIAVTPDGTRIVVAASEEYLPGELPIRVLNLSTMAEIAHFKFEKKNVSSVAISPDGTHVIGGSDGNTARVWRLMATGQELIENAKLLTPRCLDSTERQRFFLDIRSPQWCKALQKWPYDSTAVKALIEKHLKEKRWREAVRAFDDADTLEISARNEVVARIASAYDELAWQTFENVALHGESAESLKVALEDSDRAVALAPDCKYCRDTRGRIYVTIGRPDEGLADLDRALALGMTDAGTMYSRGLAHQMKGDKDTAIADYGKALTYKAEKDYAKFAQAEARKRLSELKIDSNSGLKP